MITDEYRPRRTRFLELWEPTGWAIKVYGIAYDQLPSPRLLAAAQSQRCALVALDGGLVHAAKQLGIPVVEVGS